MLTRQQQLAERHGYWLLLICVAYLLIPLALVTMLVYIL